MNTHRQIIAYKNYFLDFYENQPDNVQAKIEWTLKLIQVTRQVPEKYFKHLDGTKGCIKSGLKSGVISTGYFLFLTKATW